ncbi:RNA polymerase sigma factor [Candidatus Parcubacteria bacterium]|nr:RNA polymerase sigma factor [Candidatus Parcubacteria bacterium]
MINPRKIFSKIYNQYIDKIYRFIFLKVNSQEIAQDLTSETFLRGWEAFEKSQNPRTNDQKIENTQAFLYKIARNLVTDHYREKGKTKIVSTEYVKITDPRTNLEEKAILSSDLDTIRLALTNLKEDYQNVIIWHYLDDLSISEIAEIMDKSKEAARVQLHRALKALKNELK